MLHRGEGAADGHGAGVAAQGRGGVGGVGVGVVGAHAEILGGVAVVGIDRRRRWRLRGDDDRRRLFPLDAAEVHSPVDDDRDGGEELGEDGDGRGGGGRRRGGGGGGAGADGERGGGGERQGRRRKWWLLLHGDGDGRERVGDRNGNRLGQGHHHWRLLLLLLLLLLLRISSPRLERSRGGVQIDVVLPTEVCPNLRHGPRCEVGWRAKPANLLRRRWRLS